MRKFEWDDKKAKTNLARHKISFEEALHVFSDPNRVTKADDRFDYGEERYQTIGALEKRCIILFVVYTIRDGDAEVVRIISARRAKLHERGLYAGRKFLGE